MAYQTPEERRHIQEQWIARIEDWQSSSLSGAAWCRQEKITYHQFIYWKNRLCTEADQNIDTHAFIELEDRPASSGIEIVLNHVSLRLSRDFDSSTLLRCLKTLKEAEC